MSRELVAELSDREDATPQRSAEEKTQHEAPPPPEPRDLPPERAGPSVLCIGGRGPFDDAAAAMLVQLLEKHGVRARLEPDRAVTSSNIVRLDSAGVAMVCLSYFELGNSPAHLRHSIRRIRRQMPKAKVLAGLWGHEGNQAAGERPHADTGADLYAFSLRQAVRLCAEASSSAAPEGSGATPVAKAEPSVA